MFLRTRAHGGTVLFCCVTCVIVSCFAVSTGRWRAVHTAYWLDGDAAIIRATLEQALGPLAAWDETC
jgi:hypothetical protein